MRSARPALYCALLALLVGCGEDPLVADSGPDAGPDRGVGPDSRPPADLSPDQKPTPDGPARPDTGSGPCVRPAPPSKYTAGQVYWGRNQYIQYFAGDLPLVISSPHGGYLKPSEIPDRTTGVLGSDSNSQEYTLEAAHYLYRMTGRRPHVVINRLHRIKLDANREITEACQGSKWSEQAWTEYHQFIDAAKLWVSGRCGRGHYLDFHTNAHAAKWVEMGLMLGATDLDRSDKLLDDAYYVNKSSLRALAKAPGRQLSALARGPFSLGGLLMSRGYKSVPSPAHPHPAGQSFFSGGYNTSRHGSRNGGTIDGTQVEVYWDFINSESERDDLSYQLARSIKDFVEQNYIWTLKDPSWSPPANGRCHSAQKLTLSAAGAVTVQGTSAGTENEFGTQVTCGNSFALDGPQAYYRVQLKGGVSYQVRLLAHFPARYYLFGDSCTPAKINDQCSSSGLAGALVTANVAHKVTVKIPKTGSYTVAVDSRSAPYYGPFSLTIQQL